MVIGCKGSRKTFLFLVDSPLRGGVGKGLFTKKKRFLNVFFFAVLLTTKPRREGGGAKGLSGLSTKKRTFCGFPMYIKLNTFNIISYIRMPYTDQK